jgi:hypothetical protein
LTALIIVTVWEVPITAVLLTFAGLNVTATDVITVILFVVGVLEFAQLRTNLRGWLIPWIFLGVLIGFSLLRGVSMYGLAHATNEARGEIWVYFAMTWALAVRPERLKLHTFSLILGWMLTLVAVYHLAVHGLGSPTAVVILPDGSYGPNRILVAAQAAALLLCAGTLFLRTADPGEGRSRFARSSLVFFGVILASQHRSVWLGALAGVTAALIFANGGRARSRAAALLGIGAWLAFVGLTVVGGENAALESAANSQSYDWRTSGWQSLVADAIARGPATVALGEPYGSGFLRKIGATTTGVQAHNWYVEIFLRLGIVGLTVLVGMLVAAIWKSRAQSPEWMFSLVAVGVYASAYALDWFLAPWLAAAMVVSLRGGSVADEATESTTASTGYVARRVGANTAPRGM